MKIKICLCSASAALLMGCSSTPIEHVYTLRPAETSSPTTQSDFSLASVTVSLTASGMDRPQWVLRDPHQELQILEQQRWMQPLGEEISQSLIDQLQPQLNQMPESAPYLRLVATPSSVPWQQLADARGPRLHLDVEVSRFDTWVSPQPRINDEIIWRLHCSGAQDASLSDRQGLKSYSRLALEKQGLSSYQVLAETHQQVLGEAAEEIAQAMREMSPHCLTRAP
ncbi:MAG: membrane integrity-associated transporter subunit PqiC [Burkholderiaceae bacterium]|nr:membrane integrity-associated transporter subunit PqiC [Burkholderiaceae bacterium]